MKCNIFPRMGCEICLPYQQFVQNLLLALSVRLTECLLPTFSLSNWHVRKYMVHPPPFFFHAGCSLRSDTWHFTVACICLIAGA